MFSSDKNVETIAQLIEALKRYLGVQKEFLKLSVIEKFVRLITALTLAVVFILLGFAVLFFMSFALVYWLAPLVGVALAFLIMALIYLALAFIVFTNRKAWPMQTSEYHSLEEIQARKAELQTSISKDSEQIGSLWHELVTPSKSSSKGELIANLIANSITVIDGFLLARKLMKTYGSLFSRKKKK